MPAEIIASFTRGEFVVRREENRVDMDDEGKPQKVTVTLFLWSDGKWRLSKESCKITSQCSPYYLGKPLAEFNLKQSD